LITLVYYLLKYAAYTVPGSPFYTDARMIGVALFEAYIFPFEMVSILLLAAIVGALLLSARAIPVRPDEVSS
jgi:NADH:ubiquinone oxidoreductase subunit 6 (subunit J)